MMQSVLVTGGAGYIGAHACKALARAGYRPIAFDNLSRGRREAVRWGPFIEGERLDRALLSAAFERYRISAIIHFAARGSVGESTADPAADYRNNVEGSLALFAAMREAGLAEIVFSSSCAVYGIPDGVPIAESTPQHPVDPYDETKLAIERALHWYGLAYGLRRVALRYFNAAGTDPEGEAGEWHEPETDLVPLVLRAALGGEAPIAVYGTDYPRPDDTSIRNYVHVCDLATAHPKALEHLRRGGDCMALDLAAGRGHSVREVIAAASATVGRPIPVRDEARRTADPPARVADPTLACEWLGWRAEMSDLDTIIGTALRWHASRAK